MSPHKRCALVLLAWLSIGAAACFAQAGNSTTPDFRAIDAHALKTPEEAESSIESLAAYLVKPTKNDVEKTRAIFRWVTHNISYDVQMALNFQVKRNFKAEEVLEKRSGICGCYSNLVKALCDKAGLEAVVVSGYCKNARDPQGWDYKKNSHAWNAVKIGGKWQLLDATWGAGNSTGAKFFPEFNEQHFLTPPELVILSRFPQDEKWQLLAEPLSYKQFADQVYIDIDMFRRGFTLEQVRKRIKEGGIRELVRINTPKGVSFTVREAPIERHLEVGKSYKFVIESPDIEAIAVRVAGKFQHGSREGKKFHGTVTIPPGKDFHLYVARPDPVRSQLIQYMPILSYQPVQPGTGGAKKGQ